MKKDEEGKGGLEEGKNSRNDGGREESGVVDLFVWLLVTGVGRSLGHFHPDISTRHFLLTFAPIGQFPSLITCPAYILIRKCIPVASQILSLLII